MSQPQVITPVNVSCANSSLTQVRANSPCHIIHGQLAPSAAVWPLGHILPSLVLLANPQAITLVFGPFRPPTASTAHAQNGHKRPSGPKIPKNSMDTIFQSMASGNHQRAPTQLPERFLFPQCTLYSRFHKWCIYGIIYHYAPFLLRDPMVTFSGPNQVIPNQFPSPSPISKEDSSAIQSGNSLAATRRSFEDPNHLALQRLGYHFLIRTILRKIVRGYQSFQSVSRHKVLSIP
ncbi:hypothetical protein O181_011338 [Austropuccinia psidii MF-1]|uniref:Uncharacterized protein n=1 Tax=Austropuccinia psidii MF-1 TaxID=1389203 RepID=A0A9Q3GL73_9BASI|nr:hypothetical protein [Austropuccinia psidii MF-1]